MVGGQATATLQGIAQRAANGRALLICLAQLTTGRAGQRLQQRLDMVGAALGLDPSEQRLALVGAGTRTDRVAGERLGKHRTVPGAGRAIETVDGNVAA